MRKLFWSLVLLVSGCMPAFATSYTAPDYTESTGNYITAANWNANQTSLMTFLNNQNLDGTTNIAVGGIGTANLANLSVTDAKIYGITTYAKVNASSISSLPSLSASAGLIPLANLPVGTSANNISQLNSSGFVPPATISGTYGAWVQKSASLPAIGTTYTATTDGIACGYGYNGGTSWSGAGAADNGSGTTIRIEFGAPTGIEGGACMPVAKGMVWQMYGISGAETGAVNWIPTSS